MKVLSEKPSSAPNEFNSGSWGITLSQWLLNSVSQEENRNRQGGNQSDRLRELTSGEGRSFWEYCHAVYGRNWIETRVVVIRTGHFLSHRRTSRQGNNMFVCCSAQPGR